MALLSIFNDLYNAHNFVHLNKKDLDKASSEAQRHRGKSAHPKRLQENGHYSRSRLKSRNRRDVRGPRQQLNRDLVAVGTQHRARVLKVTSPRANPRYYAPTTKCEFDMFYASVRRNRTGRKGRSPGDVRSDRRAMIMIRRSIHGERDARTLPRRLTPCAWQDMQRYLHRLRVRLHITAYGYPNSMTPPGIHHPLSTAPRDRFADRKNPWEIRSKSYHRLSYLLCRQHTKRTSALHANALARQRTRTHTL